MVVFYEELLTTLSSQQRMITEETIERVAREVLRWPERRKWNSRDAIRRFKACFGASGTIVADVWNRIVDQEPIESGGEPNHLLWALIHLKVYSTTFSKWAWYFIEWIADLKDAVICLGNRFDGDDKMELLAMGMTSKQRKMKANARAQHETLNGRLKIFNVLTTHFRHMKPNRQGMMQKHGICFNAVAVITQLKFVSGETTFDDGLEYDKLPAPRRRFFIKRQGGGCFESYDELDPS
eukprot:jgi/Psemu1/6213/gm1.6213_g